MRIPLLTGLISLLLMACSPTEQTLLQQIKNRGELIVVTRNSPTTYYEAASGHAGFEHDLVQKFAESLGVKPKFILGDNEEDMLRALETGAAHMAAAGLSRNKSLEQRVEFSSSYHLFRKNKQPITTEIILPNIAPQIEPPTQAYFNISEKSSGTPIKAFE